MAKQEDPDLNQEATTIIGEGKPAAQPGSSASATSSRSGTQYVPPAATRRTAEVLRKLEPGVKVRKYRIIKELGRGGQGRVFLARDEELGRQVALKTIAALPLLDEATFQRFHNEGLAAARLRHPNIVQLYDVFEQDGVPFLAMEYLEGETLLSAVVGGRVSRARFLEIMVKVCEAMGSAHRDGLIHRDLKPQNVMLDKDGEPKVMDFGLAKSVAGGDDFLVATLDGQLVGSPAYMSPEQASGVQEKIGPTTDVYALGTVMYQCLSGRLPHVAETAASTIMRIIRDDPPPLKSLDPSIGEELNAICMKALEKEPRDRYANAGEMAEDLKRFLKGEPIKARPVSALTRWMKVVQRNRDVSLVSGAALAVLTIALSLGASFYARQTARRDTEERRAKFLTAATFAAMQFSPEELAQARKAQDGAAFNAIVGKLNEIRKHKDPGIQEAYIVGQAETGSGYAYIADADTGLPDADASRRPGAPFAPGNAPVPEVFREGAAVVMLVEGKRGPVLSGYAPIARDGRVAAVLAVHMQTLPVKTQAQTVLRTTAQVGGIAALLFSGFTAAVVVRIFRSRRLT